MLPTGSPRPRARALALEITGRCNQGCSYCFNAFREDGGASVGSLPTSELFELVQRALREIDVEKVVLSGGEPLARADFLEIVEGCRRLVARVHVISNGALVTQELAARLAELGGVSVQITLNAEVGELHDEMVKPSGRAAGFDAAVRGIETLVASGVRVTGTVVVTRKNAHRVGATLDRFLALGVTAVGISRFSPAGYSVKHMAELLPSRGEVLSALEQAETFARDRGMEIALVMPVPPCVIDRRDFPHLAFGDCPVGTDAQEIALGPRGELRHCLLHPQPFAQASDASFAEHLRSPAIARYRDVLPEFCEKCPESTRCAGGCGAAAVSVFGARALDPFVAQHVDPAFRAALRASRQGLVSSASLVRRPHA